MLRVNQIYLPKQRIWMALLLIWALFAMATGWASDDFLREWRQAVQHNKLPVLRQNLHRIGRVDLTTERGKTALMAAAGAGAADLVQELLKLGADVNARNQMGGTALMYAAAAGDTGTVKLLLANEANIDEQSVNGWTALMMAAAKDRSGVAAMLVAHAADVNLPDVYGWSPLMRAAYAGHADVVDILLSQPAVAISMRNDQGQTALHLAAIQGQSHIVKALLERGARPDMADFAGRTPRSIARAQGYNLPGLLSADMSPTAPQ